MKKKQNRGKIADNIEELRKLKGITQEELALRTGLSRQSISKWSTGECNPSVSSIEAVSRELNVSSSIIMCNGEIDFSELAKAYANENNWDSKELKQENKRDLKDRDAIAETEEERTLTKNIAQDKINKERTPVVNIDEQVLNATILEEAKKHFAPYLYPVLVKREEQNKAKKKNKVIKKTITISVGILMLIYVIFSLYKFVVLSKLIKEIEGLNTIDNYYAEIIEFRNNIIKEKNHIWYKEGMYKIEKTTYNDAGLEIGKGTMWVDTNNEKRYYYNEDRKEVVSDNLVNKEVYDGYLYLFEYLPDNYEELERYKIKFVLNPMLSVINNENEISAGNKVEKLRYSNGIPTHYTSKKNGEICVISFQITNDCVEDYDTKINNP